MKLSELIMVCGKGYNKEGSEKEPSEVLHHRLKNNYWPIYINTKNRKIIRTGDNLLFYVSGNKTLGGRVVAKSKVKGFVDKKNARDFNKSLSYEEEVSFGENILYFIKIDEACILKNPICMKENLSKLSFGNINLNKWGSVLQGGCRLITADDFLVLSQQVP